MSEAGPLVLFASQTGNAESISKLVYSDDLGSITPACRYMSLDAYVKTDKTLDNLAQERCLVLVVSTTGQGDIPDNGRQFLRAIKKKEKAFPTDGSVPLPYSSLKFFALGLGDSNYDKFNNGVKMLERSLIALGASRGIKSAYADDGTSLEMVVEPFRGQLKTAVTSVFTNTSNSNDTTDTPLPTAPVAPITPATTIDRVEYATVPRPPLVLKPAPIRAEVELYNNNTSSNNVDNLTTVKVHQDESNGSVFIGDTFSIDRYVHVNNITNKHNDANIQAALRESEFGFSQEIPVYGRVRVSPLVSGRDVLEVSVSLSETVSGAIYDVHNTEHHTTIDEKRASVYTVGDCIGILPVNKVSSVEYVISRLRLQSSRHASVRLWGVDVAGGGGVGVDGVVFDAHATYPHIPQSSSSEVLGLGRDVTVQELLTHCLDLHAPVKKTLVRALADHCTHGYDAQVLLELMSKGGKGLLKEYIDDQCLNVVDMLRLFPSCVPTLALLVEHVPSLKPRSYSIASSPLAVGDTVGVGALDMTVAMTLVHKPLPDIRRPPAACYAEAVQHTDIPLVDVDMKPNTCYSSSCSSCSSGERTLVGLCTGYVYQLLQLQQQLLQQQQQDRAGLIASVSSLVATVPGVVVELSLDNTPCIHIPTFIHKSPQFHLPSPHDTNTSPTPSPVPLLLVGPGTGVSPFVGFLDYLNRTLPKTNGDVDVSVGSDISSQLSNVSVATNTVGQLSLSSSASTPTRTVTPDTLPVGHVTLFSGNRSRASDFLYKSSLLAHLRDGSLSHLHSAFSREHPDGSKVYVQDVIKTQQASVAQTVMSGGYVYVCGDGLAMTKAVQRAVEEAVAAHCCDLYTTFSETTHHPNNKTDKPAHLAAYNNIIAQDPASLPEQQRAIWARALISVMVQEGKYKSDVWS